MYQPQPASYVPNVYICKGATPDHAKDGYFQYTATNDSNLFSINAHLEHVNPRRKGVVAITAFQGSYLPLNNTQCEVTFAPSEFQIDVDLELSSIM